MTWPGSTGRLRHRRHRRSPPQTRRTPRVRARHVRPAPAPRRDPPPRHRPFPLCTGPTRRPRRAAFADTSPGN
ncbi:hypothetical protein SA13R_03945 [Rothia kristinae]|nr:hypothetical protein RSA5_06805 [Rothia kristinae]KTR59815.1 hypothetical protein SA11R_02635 [Rothia kristinae]KTR69045.1 hypothetical protein SA12R_04300 [Rothia kristinae]KTR73367.1 hypothetical protein SA15R_05290 [Rothia kristinae]KTR80538.1 hypothetical protein SA14R_01080 [Rothia kristinae]